MAEQAGLALVGGLPLAGDHGLHADLLETAGDPGAARAEYLERPP